MGSHDLIRASLALRLGRYSDPLRADIVLWYKTFRIPADYALTFAVLDSLSVRKLPMTFAKSRLSWSGMYGGSDLRHLPKSKGKSKGWENFRGNVVYSGICDSRVGIVVILNSG